jgi:hypothetical protein
LKLIVRIFLSRFGIVRAEAGFLPGIDLLHDRLKLIFDVPQTRPAKYQCRGGAGDCIASMTASTARTEACGAA